MPGITDPVYPNSSLRPDVENTRRLGIKKITLPGVKKLDIKKITLQDLDEPSLDAVAGASYGGCNTTNYTCRNSVCVTICVTAYCNTCSNTVCASNCNTC
jgi:hypothetical protein